MDIKKIVLLPTLEAVVYFSFADSEPIQYTAAATQEDSVKTVSGSGPYLRLPRLKPNVNYSVTVTAEYADEDLNVVTAPVDLSTVLVTTFSRIVRQTLGDIITAANIHVEDRAVRLLSDSYGQPRSMQAFANQQVRLPAIEIDLPIMRLSQPNSATRQTETLECSIFFYDTAQDADSGFERIEMMFSLARKAINGTPNLNLAWMGVIQQSWRWWSDQPEINDQMVAQEARLTLPIPAAFAGWLPYEPRP